MFYQKIQSWRFYRFLALCVAAWLFVLAGCAAPSSSKEARHFTTVVIDAGHGGHDSGALSRRADSRKHKGSRSRVATMARVAEKDLALDVARRLQGKLEEQGLQVAMTRSDDTFVSLDERVAVSNRHRKSVFVSIHFNDSRKRSIHGAEVYHNGQGSEVLARRIVAALATVPGVANRGVKQADFRVLRNSKGPAVLVECGYLSHPAEALRCASPEYRDGLAAAIATAIQEQRR